MASKIAFIGGIHGIGKSTVCNAICSELGIQYLSASELIKWKEINDDPKNKNVNDIPNTQELLIQNLKKAIKPDVTYLLDGHYCLLNSEEKIVPIPSDIFIEINPCCLAVISGDVGEARARLEVRDNKRYGFQLLQLMQESELAYASELSALLKIPLEIGAQKDLSAIKMMINKSLF